ncbi:MAG TPA: adenylyl-sulfate kinase [Solirubrobacteraceae bacterium]|jgi:adenylyl-sulfate kinase|nr:adenylyl-sulfate kinase [Solirubrobacteraceae bacterium]
MDSSPNVTWQDGTLSRERRWQALRARGATIWITGLPSSGKSTLGAAVEERLVGQGRGAYLLDGDNLRCGICGDLGFERSDREANVQRVGELARLFADSGAVAVVALVSPYEQMRTQVRERHQQDNLPFFEVFLDTPVRVCAERDPKGLYARALSGELEGFTGIDDPYEPPMRPDLQLTPELPVPVAVDSVLELLQTLPAETLTTAGASIRP